MTEKGRVSYSSLQEFSEIEATISQKCSGTTKRTFAMSEGKALNLLSLKNQFCQSQEGEKIKNCTCFGNQSN